MSEALFEIPGVTDQPKPKASGRRWGGNDSRKARAVVALMLPAPCFRCGRIVTAEMDWHADHVQEATFGGTDEASNFAPSHKKCNESAGGRIGAAMTNARTTANDTRREKTIKWW